MIHKTLHSGLLLGLTISLGTQLPQPARAQTIEPGEALPGSAPAAGDPSSIDALKHALEPRANGLTEAEIVQAALATSPALRKTALDSDKARAVEARAQLAIVPRLDLSSRYTRISDLVVRFGDQELPQVLNQYMNQASVRLPITDLFLTILPTYRGVELLRDVAEHQEQAKQSSVAYDARLAFYGFIRAQGALVVAADSTRSLAHHVQDLEALSARGAATQTDVLRAQARLSGAQVALAQWQGNVEVSAMRLSRVLGKDVDLTRGVAEPLVDFDPGPTPEAGDVLTTAFGARHELLALRALQRAREKLAEARRGAEWPQLSASGNVYYANPNPRVFPQKEEFNTTWDVGLSLSFSPNDLMFARSQAEDAETDLLQVAQDMRMLEDAIAVEAALAVTSHRTARERIQATTQNLEASLRYFVEQENLLQAGAATPSDVLDAEAELRRAQLEWVDAFVEARLAQAALIKARGETGLARGPRSSR